ncbi:hypothetical protein EDC36_1175 [Tepidimonas ignava]|uniref:Uncharacterized protein n=1 Tax=Tepidimonas ignava TaxID=114249 RepID=A0A4R3L695_9BURK|nr:hypothetical protein [Tepidimonas ignava]TCS94535.1 hypothetical protein EDC36_1175 [Tepidimonas ignava]TSE18295.1 hypothetical protein Tigna_02573 [Tepidimonas ignava]
MLTISSIAVGPSPQVTPTVRAQPLTPARPGNAVAREAVGADQVAPQGEAARAQVAATPPLAPVSPAQEAQRAEAQTNPSAPERTGLPVAGPEGGPRQRAQAQAVQDEQRRAERARVERDQQQQAEQRRTEQAQAKDAQQAQTGDDQGFPPVKNPALEALDTQIKELLPNLWKASRAAVDMVIGDEAREAAQQRAKALEELHTRLNAPPLANLPPGEPQQTYGAAADQGGSNPQAGRRVDRLV